MLLLVFCNLNLLITSLITSIKQLFYAVYFLRFGEQKKLDIHYSRFGCTMVYKRIKYIFSFIFSFLFYTPPTFCKTSDQTARTFFGKPIVPPFIFSDSSGQFIICSSTHLLYFLLRCNTEKAKACYILEGNKVNVQKNRL